MKPSQVLNALQYTAIEKRRPVFLWGPPGAGKSDVVAQLAEKLKIGLVDKRLSQSDPTELKGYPWPDQEKKIMSFFRDGELPTKGRGILFLDEMNLAPQATQNPAYQLILNRRLGEYVLPDGWAIIAAGNRSTDRSGVHTMSAALSNRFVHIDFDPDVEDWVKWALSAGISDGTRGYIRFRPANLYTDKIEPGTRAYPTPRTWAFADEIVNSGLPADVELELLKGTVGEGVALEYVGFLREQKNLPDVDLIAVHPEKVPVPEAPSTCYAVLAALDSQLTLKNFGNVLKYVKRMPKEFEVMFMQATSRRDSGFDETEVMTEWMSENYKVLIGV